MNLAPRAFWIATLILLLAAAGQWAPETSRFIGVHASLWWRPPGALLLLLVCIEGLSARLIQVPVIWHCPGKLQLARSGVIQLQINNPYPRVLILDVFLRDTPAIRFRAMQHRIRLQPGESRAIDVPVMPASLGDCALPPVPLRLLGRFGLIWWSRGGSAGRCQVIPDALHGNERRIAIRPNGLQARRRRGHGLELLSLRDYQPGDSIRRVHWKATARSRRLIVQDRIDEQRLELVIVIDTGRASGLQMGAAEPAPTERGGEGGDDTLHRVMRLHHNVNIAARLGELALSMGDRLSLITYADRVLNEQLNLMQASGARRLRASLAALSPSARESTALAAAMAIRRLKQPRSLVVWLTDFDSGDQTSLVRATRLLMPRHLPVLVTACDPALERLAEQPARNWADPHVSLAAMQTRDALRETEIKLTRLGAEVVVSAPQHLDTAVLERYENLKIRGRV